MNIARNHHKDLVHGVGINDAIYSVTANKVVDGRKTQSWICPIYLAWRSMIGRCYSDLCQEKHPTYRGCSVSAEWLTFSKFHSWMSVQDYAGNHLDKDILVPGNKVYSEESCVFVSPKLNTFLNSLSASRGQWPIGVYCHKPSGKFNALCRNPFTGKQESLGLFESPEEAHEKWRARKHQHACSYADIQTDPRVAAALRVRFIRSADQEIAA